MIYRMNDDIYLWPGGALAEWVTEAVPRDKAGLGGAAETMDELQRVRGINVDPGAWEDLLFWLDADRKMAKKITG
jgi:hypothetical protein